jgi:hypothetical protein
MSETMGFCTHRPTVIPHAHRSRHPTAVAVLQFVLRRHAAAAVGTTLNLRATSAVAASSWSAPPVLPGPATRLPPSKVHASAPPSPALYHVLPRTSPFSNINIRSVFPGPCPVQCPAAVPASGIPVPVVLTVRVPAPGAGTVTTAMLHRRGSDHRDAPSSWLGPGRCRGCPGARGAGVAAGARRPGWGPPRRSDRHDVHRPPGRSFGRASPAMT